MTGERSPGGYRWLVFALLSSAYLMVYFHRTSPAVVAVEMMKDLGTGAALMGLLGSAYFYPYALMQLPAGLLSDSWGPRRTVTIFFLLAGLASVLFGLSQSTAMAIVSRALVGLGASMLFVPTMKILTHWFRKSEFSMMTGLMMAMGGVGALTASYPLARMSVWLGWRGSFMVVGGLTVVLAVLIGILVRDRPEQMGFSPVEPAGPAGAGAPAAIGLMAGLGLVLKKKAFWPLAIWFFFTCGVFFTFAGLWGGPYLMHVYGVNKPQAGWILNMIAVAMIVGSPLLSYLSDRVFRSRKTPILITSVVMLLLTGILAFAPKALPLGAMYVFCFLLAFCSSAIVVVAFTATKELFPVSIAGTAMGAVNLFPFLGGAVMQFLVGLFLDAQGPVGGPYPAEVYGRAFGLFLVAAVIAFAASLLMEETHHR
jgi:sugar phosphate permease